MRNGFSKKELARGACFLLGWILLLSFIGRLWIVFIVALAITLLLTIKSKKAEKFQERPEKSVIEDTAKESDEDRLTVILKQINELVESAYPGAKWVWKNPNALNRIEKGEEVIICLNKAAGFKYAKVITNNLRVQGLDFTVNEKKDNSDKIEVEETETVQTLHGEDNVNYDLLAYDWVQDNMLLLNERINELIGQGETELIIRSEELPVKESWRNICNELVREGIKEIEFVPDGIKFNFKKELSKNE